jgi:putative endonuclease
MTTEYVAMPYYLYILASGRHGTLCIGVTNDLVRRVDEHRTDAVPGFTKKHRIHRLVYYGSTTTLQKRLRERSASSAGRGHGKWN